MDSNSGHDEEQSRSLIPVFISSLSHDLRSPLNTITGYSEILLDGLSGELNDVQLDYSNRIHRAAARMSHFVNDIIDVSRIEMGTVECGCMSFDVTEVVRDAVVALESESEEGGPLIRCDCEAGVFIESDSERVFQCVDILLRYAKTICAGEFIRVSLTSDESRVEISIMVEPVESTVIRKYPLYHCDIIASQLLGGALKTDEQNDLHTFRLVLPR